MPNPDIASQSVVVHGNPQLDPLPRILLCLEHHSNRQILADLLASHYQVQVTNLLPNQELMPFDLCIVDGPAFGRLADYIAGQRASVEPIFLPFLLLVKRSQLPQLTLEQRRQVDDVITVPVDRVELLLRIESLLRARQLSLRLSALLAQEQLLEQKLQADNETLHQLATLDGLTGLANRRTFDEKLDYEWKVCRREQVPLFLLLCDIDHFKAYNDYYGHPAGDRCLQAVSTTLATIIRRPADLAARYGGEEFALILPRTDWKGALHMAELVRQTLQTQALPHAASPTAAHITLSCGLAGWVPSDTTTPEDLVQAADEALYQAKATGRDRLVLHQSSVATTT